MVADAGVPLKTTPLIFHSEPMMMAINYARNLEADGIFGDKARDGWELAGEELRRYAVREIPTSWDVPIRLGLREAELARAERLAAELETLLPGRFATMEAKRAATLTDAQRQALGVPPLDRTEDQQDLVSKAEQAMKVNWPMVARDAPANVRDQAQRLAADYIEAQETAEIIDRYRDIVNFDFWRATCEMEVTDSALRAREATWRAEQDYEAARLRPAKEAFEEAFAAYREVLDASDVLRSDALTREELIETIDQYREVLEQLDEPFPSPFVLDDVLKNE